MKPFTTLSAIAAPIAIADVDTDMLFPAPFLKTISRHGLADALFHNLRADDPDFPLNRHPWNHAGIIVALDNFGCGSSREHAPWALLDFGIRCVIAPSFADIFHGNCFKNGILPIVLARQEVEALLVTVSEPATAMISVDLERQLVILADGQELRFSIDPQHKERLLRGIDEIGTTLTHEADIIRHEEGFATAQPWMKPIPEDLP